MKTIIVLFLLFTISSLFSCIGDSTSSNDDDNENIEFYNVELKGCNNIEFFSKLTETNDLDTIIYEKDTVIIKTANDTTTVSVNLHYICAWKFDHTYEITEDTLFLTIIDTCSTNCGAWCYCDYIFDYKFSNLDREDMVYKAYFESLRDDSRIIGIGEIK